MAATVVRRAPYKDFLQPALHRRFTSTATVLLAVSYLQAILLAQWSSYLWAWFPLGSAGIRTLFIFASGLAIVVLRIAQYHVGLRTAGSGWQTLRASLASLYTYETAFWYIFSSGLFCQIFLWSTPENSGMRWITYFGGDRARLNERPLYLSCYLTTCALMQTIAHFQLDIDRLDLGLSKKFAGQAQGNGSSLRTVMVQLPAIFLQCVTRAITALPVTHVLYYFIVRSTIWGWALTFLRPFYNLSKTNILPPFVGFDVLLLTRCALAGTMVGFLWAAGNTAFSAFMVKEPLKHGKPLTSESKDPNGSLLNGLKSQKPPVKSFAMWELALIAQGFDVRRQAIFDDIDRKDGPMWSQVYAICMDIIKGIDTRVDNYGKAPAPAAPVPVEEPRKRVTAPLKDDPIYTSRAGSQGGAGKTWDQIARAPGTSPASKLSPVVQKTWKDAKDRVLTKEQQDSMTPDHLKGQFEHWAMGLMRFNTVSSLFRREFRTEFAGTVLGAPYAEPTLFAHAATTLCELASRSLTEDKFGNVHRDVPSIIRTFSAIIKKVEALKERFPLHWTDEQGVKECPEVDEILDAMRAGLEQVVTKFEPYASDLRLTLSDIRLAKEAMVEVQPEEPKQKVQEPEPEQKSIQTSGFEQKRVERRVEKRAEEKVQPRRSRVVEMEQVRSNGFGR